jgi:hypothetical protein
MTGSVRYDRQHDTWFFNGVERRHDGAASIVVKHGDLAAAAATDLVREMRKARNLELEPEFILIDTAPDDYYWPKNTVVENIAFLLGDNDELVVKLGFEGSEQVLDDRQLRATIDPLLDPLLHRSKAAIKSVRADSGDHSGSRYHHVELTVATRGRTLSDVYAVADSAQALLHAAHAGELTRQNARDLIVGGRAGLLVGLPESSWLDVKSQHYNLDTDQGKISLAEAVSRFCNAGDGGIVVVGMDTRKQEGGGEIIKSLRPVSLDARTARRYRQAVENRVFPFPTGFDVDIVETNPGQGLVVVSIPRQEEELKPFLVHGAFVNGKVQGAYISIVRRSGEDSIPITAQQIHGTLAAGRALLRRGEIPPR